MSPEALLWGGTELSLEEQRGRSCAGQGTAELTLGCTERGGPRACVVGCAKARLCAGWCFWAGPRGSL